MDQGDRVRTFIHGFDEKLGGGIPEGAIVLLTGEPGTMKSTIAFNILYQNALREVRISPEERASAFGPKD